MKRKILITGAGGQIGTELATALRVRYGAGAVIATDIRPLPDAGGPSLLLNVMSADDLAGAVQYEGITEIYHLAAVLSATGEQRPLDAWELNMQGLLNVLEVARATKCRVFWPSSIAVFGVAADKAFCQQDSVTQPTTVYGISKAAGENWCQYYHKNYGVDVRSIRYPGLISHSAPPGGGTTDYAVDIFHHAARGEAYTCFLKGDTVLPMMYMPDAVAGTLQLMEAPAGSLSVRTAYSVAGFNFSPDQLAAAIRRYLPTFAMDYRPDFRQRIADSWPQRLDDARARSDWGWKPQFGLDDMVSNMLMHLTERYRATGGPTLPDNR